MSKLMRPGMPRDKIKVYYPKMWRRSFGGRPSTFDYDKWDYLFQTHRFLLEEFGDKLLLEAGGRIVLENMT